jgi:hypothetical protein
MRRKAPFRQVQGNSRFRGTVTSHECPDLFEGQPARLLHLRHPGITVFQRQANEDFVATDAYAAPLRRDLIRTTRNESCRTSDHTSATYSNSEPLPSSG